MIYKRVRKTLGSIGVAVCAAMAVALGTNADDQASRSAPMSNEEAFRLVSKFEGQYQLLTREGKQTDALPGGNVSKPIPDRDVDRYYCRPEIRVLAFPSPPQNEEDARLGITYGPRLKIDGLPSAENVFYAEKSEETIRTLTPAKCKGDYEKCWKKKENLVKDFDGSRLVVENVYIERGRFLGTSRTTNRKQMLERVDSNTLHYSYSEYRGMFDADGLRHDSHYNCRYSNRKSLAPLESRGIVRILPGCGEYSKFVVLAIEEDNGSLASIDVMMDKSRENSLLGVPGVPGKTGTDSADLNCLWSLANQNLRAEVGGFRWLNEENPIQYQRRHRPIIVEGSPWNSRTIRHLEGPISLSEKTRNQCVGSTDLGKIPLGPYFERKDGKILRNFRCVGEEETDGRTNSGLRIRKKPIVEDP